MPDYAVEHKAAHMEPAIFCRWITLLAGLDSALFVARKPISLRCSYPSRPAEAAIRHSGSYPIWRPVG